MLVQAQTWARGLERVLALVPVWEQVQAPGWVLPLVPEWVQDWVRVLAREPVPAPVQLWVRGSVLASVQKRAREQAGEPVRVPAQRWVLVWAQELGRVQVLALGWMPMAGWVPVGRLRHKRARSSKPPQSRKVRRGEPKSAVSWQKPDVVVNKK